jgi:CDP-paratose 2-epimerase
VQFAPDRHGDLHYFICDISRAQRDLGWTPRIMPEEGIERLMAWIGDNKAIFNKK